jgi:hypothetical protein
VRKKLCLAYLEWAAECNKDGKEKVVELAKEWRKVDKRVGKERSKVERIARRFFRDITKQKNRSASRKAASEFAKKQMENKEGVHSEEFAERRRQLCIENRRKQVELGLGQSKWWIITAPDGTEFAIRSMAKWARENGISKDGLLQTEKTVGKTVDGYRCRRFNPEIDKMP